MPLGDLQRAPALGFANEPDPFDDPRVLADHKIEALQPRLTLLHPDWVPTVFYDPIRFPNETARELILGHYAREMPDLDVHLEALAAADMSRIAIAKYPQSEEIFRRRGFVADVEVTAFDRKDHHAATRYLVRHKAAVCLQLAMIDDLLDRRSTSPAWKAWREKQLAALHGGSRKLPVPLVERDGVFVPAQALRPGEKIHLAHSWTLDLALEHGHRDREGLVAAMPDELLKQLRFERDNSRSIFGARPAALLLWQSQALAALRKTTWQVELATSTALNKQETNETNAQVRALRAISRTSQQRQRGEERARERALRIVHRALRRWAVDEQRAELPAIETVYLIALEQHRNETRERARAMEAFQRGINNVALPKGAFVATVGDLVDAYAEKLAALNAARRGSFYGPGLGSAEYTYNLSPEQIIVAALHGATYCPHFDPDDRHDREDPIHWLQPLALWIGELKRQRTASFSESIATSVLAVLMEMADPDLDDPNLGPLARLIVDRLGAPAWAVLGAAAEALLAQDSPAPLVVVYDWTRDTDQPWQAEQRADGTVVIRGPLLDFPRSQAALWNERATAIVRAENGLLCGKQR